MVREEVQEKLEAGLRIPSSRLCLGTFCHTENTSQDDESGCLEDKSKGESIVTT